MSAFLGYAWAGLLVLWMVLVEIRMHLASRMFESMTALNRLQHPPTEDDE